MPTLEFNPFDDRIKDAEQLERKLYADAVFALILAPPSNTRPDKHLAEFKEECEHLKAMTRIAVVAFYGELGDER